MILIIVEKPDVARHLANSLKLEKKNGYFQDNKFFLTNMRGHLFSSESHSKYTGSENWLIEKLPIIPENLLLKIKNDDYCKNQINLIKSLLDRSDEVINGMDSDREGELIFRNLKQFLNIKKPIKRLWLQDLDDSTIIEAMNNLYLYDDKEIDKINTNIYRLSEASELRNYLDWIVGINATQFATLKYGQGKQIALGRVQTAVLKILGDRESQYKNHVKTLTYRVQVKHLYNNILFFSYSDIFDNIEEIEKKIETLDAQFEVLNFECVEYKKNPPLLYDLNQLIIEANNLFKYTGAQILETAQSLYEKKLLSYPRTDCQYIKEERFEKYKNLIKLLSENINLNNYQAIDKPQSVNNDKVDSSHDAIICINTIGNESLTEIERNVYDLVASRMLQSFSKPAIYNKKKITLANKINFVATSSEVIFHGFEDIKKHFFNWKFSKIAIEESTENENDKLPAIPIQTEIDGIPGIKEIESKPKPIFTVATLTNALMKIINYLKEEGEDVNELKKHIDFSDIGLGTENTRVHIIERLIKVGYVEIKNNKYQLTDFGTKIYTMVKDTIIAKVSNTAKMEVQLKMLEKKLFSFSELKSIMKNFTTEVLRDLEKVTPVENINVRESKGDCPKCKKGNINEFPKSFNCSEYKNGCDFTIWKTIAQKNLSEKVVKDLITKKITTTIKGFKSKTNKPFEAKLKLNDDFKVEFQF